MLGQLRDKQPMNFQQCFVAVWIDQYERKIAGAIPKTLNVIESDFKGWLDSESACARFSRSSNHLLRDIRIVAYEMQSDVQMTARARPATQSKFAAQSSLLLANNINGLGIRKNPREQSVSIGKRLGSVEEYKLLIH
jgi:hypothetical protein